MKVRSPYAAYSSYSRVLTFVDQGFSCGAGIKEKISVVSSFRVSGSVVNGGWQINRCIREISFQFPEALRPKPWSLGVEVYRAVNRYLDGFGCW